jgi:hypothetical protein
MALAITYTDAVESRLCLTLQTGDTLAAGAGQPAINGPATVYFPYDGSHPIYKQAVAAGVIATATKPAHPPKPV